MKTLTIRNLPDDLHAQLKDRARHNRRSLNGEVVAILCGESEVRPPELDKVAKLRIIDEQVEAQNAPPVTNAQVDDWKRLGRS
ncbi:MAG: Arc family DNA-binding protein [Candidatus Hydrogenedentota bacterium]